LEFGAWSLEFFRALPITLSCYRNCQELHSRQGQRKYSFNFAMRRRTKQINFLSGEVGKLLIKKKLTIAVAESCTGGLLSSYMTDISGSSEYFILGIVAYSKSRKERVLKIPKAILEKYSSVSDKVSSLMAQNVKRIAKTDIGIGITGYAGPAGGTAKDPKGTVYIAVAFGGKILVKRHLFKGTRVVVKRKAVKQALRLLYTSLRNAE